MSVRFDKNNIFYSIVFLTVLVFIIFGFYLYIKTYNEKKIVDYDVNILQQFIWMHPPESLDEDKFHSFMEKGDPLNSSVYAFSDFYKNRSTKEASIKIEEIISKWDLYETHKLNYPYAYDKMPVGWWSAMDNIFFPLLLVSTSQVDKNPKHVQLAKDMLETVLKSPLEGGVLWEGQEGCWLSEYAWSGMSLEDESYVLNGNLFALHALKLLADALEIPSLDEKYNCALEGTKYRVSQFLNKNDIWPSYKLNPKTINPPHYVIFETIQFHNLYTLTNDIFFKEQEDARRTVLKERYPIYALAGADGERLLFSLMGAPHPYLLDIYGVRITCIEPDGTTKMFEQYDQFDSSKSISQRSFINETMSFTENTECVVVSNKRGMDFELYKTSDFKLVSSTNELMELNNKVTASLDAFIDASGKVIVDPARVSSEKHLYLNTQGRINYEIDPTLLEADSFLGLELTPDMDLKIGVQLSDGKNSLFRYYPNLKADKNNLVLLSKLGFDNSSNLSELSGATISIYTHDEDKISSIKVGRVLLFKDQSVLATYFSGSDAFINLTD